MPSKGMMAVKTRCPDPSCKSLAVQSLKIKSMGAMGKSEISHLPGRLPLTYTAQEPGRSGVLCSTNLPLKSWDCGLTPNAYTARSPIAHTAISIASGCHAMVVP